ncbi:MAG TPA: Nif3-like dinuclear metal center hexameric protein [Bacteroidetes bacterium]|nr:Nif3-like dinuclear metal center hexameric protein [Bacteroidota bacterium]
MTKLKDIVTYLNGIAPLSYQESYDNSGLLTGDVEMDVNGALLTIDVTEEVVEEAVLLGLNLIIAHHPIIFKGLKKLTGDNPVERTVITAILNNIAIFAGHTNFDSIAGGVSTRMAEKLGLENINILSPKKGALKKLVTFIPVEYVEEVRRAIFEAGAGTIGNYNECSFNVVGEGTFRGSENTHPFVGEPGVPHSEKEVRTETIFPAHLQSQILRALTEAHPYEEQAYDIYPLENEFPLAGLGVIGNLPAPLNEKEFLDKLKKVFNTSCIRHTPLLNKPVNKVALCGGTGSFLLETAIRSGADFYVSADFKYHEFFNANRNIVIADIGHFESEQFTTELFYDLLLKKFPNFALHFSKVKTNPINYY